MIKSHLQAPLIQHVFRHVHVSSSMEITMEFSFVGNPLFRQTIQCSNPPTNPPQMPTISECRYRLRAPPTARSPPRSCPSPDEAVAEIRDALGSIGGTCPECPSNV
jgi:hypothetical protein